MPRRDRVRKKTNNDNSFPIRDPRHISVVLYTRGPRIRCDKQQWQNLRDKNNGLGPANKNSIPNIRHERVFIIIIVIYTFILFRFCFGFFFFFFFFNLHH